MKRRSRCHSTAAFADSVLALPFPVQADAQPDTARIDARFLTPEEPGDGVNRDWAVCLARQRLMDPEYPSRETLAEIALTLARLHRPVGQA